MDVERRRTGGPREKQGVGDGLGIGIGKLPIICPWEKVLPPLRSQASKGPVGGFKSLRHLVTEQTTERSDELRELARRTRNEWLPPQEVLKKQPERITVGGIAGSRAISSHIPGEGHKRSDSLTLTIKCPFIPVRIKEIGECLESLPLLSVMAGIPLGPRAFAWRFEFRVPAKKAVDNDCVVRSPYAVGQMRFAHRHHGQTKTLSGRR
jgi:hypothetical protein